MSESIGKGITRWVLASLALTFPIFTTFDIQENYIRVAAADFLLPFIALFSLHQWLTRAQPWPQWRSARLSYWLGALTFWLTIALVVGRFHTGGWQAWAIFNKYIGWYVLLAFLVVGAWAGQSASPQDRRVFLRCLICGCALITLVDSVYFTFDLATNARKYTRMTGLSDNPNSFGYLIAVVLCATMSAAKKRPLLTRHLDVAIIGVLICGLLFSGSRSAMAGLAAGFLVLGLTRNIPWGTLVRGAIVATVLVSVVTGLSGTLQDALTDPSATEEPLYYRRNNMLSDSGVNHRIRITQAALELMSRHPVIGSGLGSFYWEEKQRQEPDAATIHNTALWLGTETGLIGLGLFATACIAIGAALWRASRDGALDPVANAGFAALAVMVGASLGMEAMYQRHVWFLLGYALVARTRTSEDET